MATGVDIDMPYQNKVYNLPKGAGKDAQIEVQWQQRKVFDSKEFFRKDLLDRNYFDNVAKKLGLGENLNDSISESTPIIQNIIATSNTAKSLSSYCWAAVGVGLAMQDSWNDFFEAIANRKQAIELEKQEIQRNNELFARAFKANREVLLKTQEQKRAGFQEVWRRKKDKVTAEARLKALSK